MKFCDWVVIGGFVLAACCFFSWESNYEANTELEARVAIVEMQTHQNTKHLEKIDCIHTYDARLCEPDFLVVPSKDEMKRLWDEYQAEEEEFDKHKAQKMAEMIIIEKESFSAKPYRDGCMVKVPKGQKCPQNKLRYSNGYGTLAKTPTETISQKEALNRKRLHLQNEVYKYIPDNVYDSATYVALVDIGYNAGWKAIQSVVNDDGSLNIVAYQKWNKFQGKTNAGLERRRKDLLIFTLGSIEQ